MSGSNFGEILETWEQMRDQHSRDKVKAQTIKSKKEQPPQKQPSKTSFSELIDSYLPDSPKEDDLQADCLDPNRKRPEQIPVDDSIDLHGFTIDQAEGLVRAFLTQARVQGKRKVLIIHGKGNHSSQGGILRTWVQQFLETWKSAGARGPAPKHQGGNGATWVILKR